MSDNETKIRALLENIAKEQKLQNHEVVLTSISSGGANYTSTLHVATITSDNKDDLHVFIKVAAMGEQMRQQLKIYEVEHFIYTELQAKFRRLEDKHGIAEDDRLGMSKFYGANTNHMEEIIVLENLVKRGFSSHDRMKSVDWEYVASATRELAKLHALSMAIEDDNPEEFAKLIKYFHLESLEFDGMDVFFNTNKKAAMNAVSEENFAKLEKFLQNLDFVSLWNHGTPKREVLIHGDFRPSNMMHRTRDVSMKLILRYDKNAMAESEAKILALLHDTAKKENLEKYDIVLTPISSGGANYTSILYVATITSGNNDDLNLFIKVAAMGEKMRNIADFKIYEVENFIYTELQNNFRRLEDKHGVTGKDRLNMSKYYNACTVPMEELIILENLVSKGFTTQDRLKSVDWEYAASAIRELAKLHALSMALDDENPEEFNKLLKYFHFEPMVVEGMDVYFDGNKKGALNAVSEENKERLKKYLDDLDFASYWDGFKPLKHKVLLHGDYRPSNLMHRTRDDGSVEVIPVDYQTLRGGCLVADLLYFIFLGTDKQFRAQYYEKLINHYYTELSAALTRLGLNPDEKYSREDFDTELREKLPFGLGIAVFTLPIVTVEAENAPTVDENMDLSSFSIEVVDGVVDDYVRWGVI